MADRTLRGSRLGAVSYETDRHSDLAPRSEGSYLCRNGHRFTVPFAADAEIPAMWECRVDGTVAHLDDGHTPEDTKLRPARTHWDMLVERRSMKELEEVLTERLELLRDRRGRAA
ncbi:MAG: RNA polymerase-binding protein RbpA [Mycobacteriales bacterium]